jgi:DNA polymerase epsilon subunit 2
MNKDHIKSFRINSILLAADANSRLNELLTHRDKDSQKDFVETIIRKIERVHLQNGKLTCSYLDTIVAELDETAVSGKAVVSLISVDLDKIPVLCYNQALKCFEPRHEQPKMFGNASDKIRMHTDRYNLVKQRILRNSLWNQTSNKGAAKLTSIESLQGTVHEHFIFGFLSQLKEGEFFLEDANSRVRLDLSQVTPEKMSAGAFTEGCLVICKGIQVDDKFVVDSLYMPPPESSEETVKNFPGSDFFGCAPSQKVANSILDWENTRSETSIYVLSDVWLDSEKVIRSLKLMFARFNDNGVIPDVMILCGNFMSRDYGQHFSDFETVKSNFRELADIIAQFPKIASTTHFVFVPGHSDTGIPVFPYQPISKVFRTALVHN